MGSLQAEQAARVEKAKKKAQRKAYMFSEVLFQNEQGRAVMDEIKKQFDVDILCVEDPHETIIRAAQRDVVRWIEEVITRGQGYDVEG